MKVVVVVVCWLLWWWFQIVFFMFFFGCFHPIFLGEDEPILTSIFSKWVVQPATCC